MRQPWTDRERDILREQYPHTATTLLAIRLGRSVVKVYSQAVKLGLKKDETYLNSENSGRLMAKDTRGLPTRFPKGHIPFNKGKKWWQYLSLEDYHRQLRTSFRKGHPPVNHKPVGSTRVNIYGYMEIKTAEPNQWDLLHRQIWVENNGCIPRGMIISFRDGNSRNCNIENLFLITRQENMRRNTIHRYPEDLRSAIRAQAKLKRQISYGTK
jgi:hypothetical protein